MRYERGVSEGQHPGKILNKVNIYMNKEYKLLEAGHLEIIELMLNDYAGQGWNPMGGVSIQQINGIYLYTQTMVREKSDINETNSDNGKQLLHG